MAKWRVCCSKYVKRQESSPSDNTKFHSGLIWNVGSKKSCGWMFHARLFGLYANYSFLVACLTHLCNLQDSRPQRSSKLEINNHFFVKSWNQKLKTVVCSGQRMLATHYLGTCNFEVVFPSGAATLAFPVARSHQHDSNLGWTDHVSDNPIYPKQNSDNFRHGRER